MILKAFTAMLRKALGAKTPAGAAHSPIAVGAFEMPYSAYASREANALAAKAVEEGTPNFFSIGGAREFYGKFNDDRLVEMQRAFKTVIEPRVMGGVKVDWVTPADGIADGNRDRVLVNLHGGAFMWGSGSGALIEAIPVAAVAKIAVVTVDYRLAPENKFPAASQDVAAVYAELLKSYRPENIGIYGCSAGGILTAQTLAWLQSVNLPLPGAIGLFCGTAYPAGGDSVFLAAASAGQKVPPVEKGQLGSLPTPYMEEQSLSDPLAYPLASEAHLRALPPTLLITAGRDFAASMMTTVHRKMAALDVDAELYVFDGLWHAFFMYPDMPESHEVFRLIARFFERRLGKRN